MGILSRADRFLAVTALITFLFFASQLGALGSRERVTSSGRVFDPEKRLFGGPGSSPPTCRSKCGRCFPCRAVHVAIQPGMSIPLEYYPEAWRCKCGNKLYMP